MWACWCLTCCNDHCVWVINVLWTYSVFIWTKYSKFTHLTKTCLFAKTFLVIDSTPEHFHMHLQFFWRFTTKIAFRSLSRWLTDSAICLPLGICTSTIKWLLTFYGCLVVNKCFRRRSRLTDVLWWMWTGFKWRVSNLTWLHVVWLCAFRVCLVTLLIG